MIKVFHAVRLLTRGNLLFRDKIIIDTSSRTVSYWKRNRTGIGYYETKLNFREIVCVNVHKRNELLMFSRISIVSRGGLVIVANGFSPKDIKQIRNMLP